MDELEAAELAKENPNDIRFKLAPKKDKDGNVEIQIFANNVQTNIENGKIVKRKSF